MRTSATSKAAVLLHNPVDVKDLFEFSRQNSPIRASPFLSRRSACSFLSLSKSAIAFLALLLMSTLLRPLRTRIYASGVNYRGSIYF